MKSKKNGKRRITTKLAMLGLVATCVTGGLVAGTMAKYVGTVSATSSARVAKFDYGVTSRNASNNGDTQWDKTVTNNIELFSYINDTGMIGTNGIGADGKQTVAPGTGGFLQLEIENKSEVAVHPSLKLGFVNDLGVPLVFEYKGILYSGPIQYDDYIKNDGNGSNLKLKLNAKDSTTTEYIVGNTFEKMTEKINQDLEELSAVSTQGTSVKASTVEVKWYWPYEVYNIDAAGNETLVDDQFLGDLKDNSLGNGPEAIVTMKATVTFTQLDNLSTVTP